jgi:serine/threonine protein kinase
MVGRTIGKYRVVEKLGRGGMGTVYKAVDETLDREVAIKILNPEMGDSDVMRRFRAEASMLAKLNHPAIATIYELHRSDDDLLMVMEFVRGESLDQFVQRSGPVEPERAAYLLSQVLDAIGHAHAAGIIHRDLKPSNVMVTENGAVKIMDFGIARVRGAEHMTTDGYMMGTPAYMSPEQVLCQEVDGRSDLYSVGVMFYRLLTGKLPFEADTAIGMVQKQISDMPTPARLHRADLPAWAVAIVDRALAKSPADRYQTAEQLRRALLDAIHDQAAEATTLILPSHAVARAPKTTPRPGDPNAETWMAAAPAPLAPTVSVLAPPSAGAPGGTPSSGPSPAPAATRSAPQRSTPAGTAAAVSPVSPVGPPKATAPAPAARPAPKALPAALVLVAVAAVVIGIVGWRRSETPAPSTSASAETVVSAPAAAPPAAADPTPPPAAAEPAVAAATPAPAPAPSTPTVDTVAPSSSVTPAGTTATASSPAPAPSGSATTPTRPSRPARGTASAPAPVPASAPAPEPPTPTPPEPPPSVVVASTPKPLADVQFRARMLVKEDNKQRERDATVRLADGQVTVTASDRTVLSALPYDAVLSVIYSKSKQPLWDSPGGATPIQQVDGGAFGFLKGGRHWVSLRTKERFVVLRVEENQVASVLSVIEDRTGKKTVRVTEPKGSQ